MSSSSKKITGKIIGVEAGGEWLKIAAIDGASGVPTFSKLSLTAVEGGVDGLAGVFAGAWKAVKAGKEPVIACLPRQLVTVRMIELPSSDAAEIDDMVDLQVGKQTPYSKDEIVFDYKLVGSGREGYTTVMLAIAQRSVVRQVFYAFEEAGIEADKVTVSTEAIAAWSGQAVKGDACRAILDIDSYFSDFIVVQGNAILFSRSFLVGADHLGDERSVGRLVKDVQSSLEVLRGERSDLSIGSIAVSGVTDGVQGLVKGLKDAGLKCSIADALKALKRPPSCDAGTLQKLKKVSLSSLVGIAKAPGELEFNLVPNSVSVRRGLLAKAKSLTALGTLVMTVLVSLSIYASIRGFTRWERLSGLEKELAETVVRADEVARMMDVVRQVRERKDPGRSALALLLDLRSSLAGIGDQIKISNIDVDVANDTFRFAGVADNTREIRALVKALEKGSYFKNVRESGTTSDRASKKYKFQVSGQLEVAK